MDNEKQTLVEWQRAAIEHYIQRASVPILYDTEQRLFPRGTGTLLEVETRLFLITAAHVVSDIKPENLAFPRKDSGVQTFGKLLIYRYDKSNEVDVAIVEILERDVIDLLKSNWNVIEFKDTACEGQYAGSRILGGYPEEVHHWNGFWIYQSMFILVSEKLDHIPDVENKTVFDQFYLLPNKGEFWNGTTGDIPNLKGASGGAIWTYVGPEDGLWNPRASVKVVAIQISAKQKSWFRGLDWVAVREIFRRQELNLTNVP